MINPKNNWIIFPLHSEIPYKSLGTIHHPECEQRRLWRPVCKYPQQGATVAFPKHQKPPGSLAAALSQLLDGNTDRVVAIFSSLIMSVILLMSVRV